MVLITIDGPGSNEAFGTGFARIQLALASEQITTVLARDGEHYAGYGHSSQ